MVSSIHDHLYASANIRTPEELQSEVAKILLAVVWGQREGRAWPPGGAGSGPAGGQEETAAAAARVRRLFEGYKRAHGGYPAGEPLALDDRSIAYVGTRLASFTFGGAERDWLGDALEVFRSIAAKRLGGQFFTDQRVTDLAMRLLEFDPRCHDLLDVCAGTGGFLIAAHKRARALGVAAPARVLGIEADAKLAHLANSTLAHFGRAGGGPAVGHGDSLRPVAEWGPPLAGKVAEDSHQRLASNPPFGVKITISDPAILSRLDLGHGWKRAGECWERTQRIVPRPPDVLFLERNLRLAEPGSGRVALVTPYQVLSGPRLGYVREWLLRHARLVAVVDLPADTFQPWTGTKTALIVYERRSAPLPRWNGEDYPVFMALARHIGHDRRGRPVLDGRGGIRTDLPDVARAFEAWRGGTDPATVHPGAFVTRASRITPATGLRFNAAFCEPAAVGARMALAGAQRAQDYRVVRLGDVTKRVFCPGRFRRRYTTGPGDGVLFLGGGNITQLVTTNRKYLSRSDPHLDGLRVEAGWVLVTRSGSTGIVSSVPPSWHGLAVSEHVIRIVPDDEALDGRYLEAYLRSRLGQRLLAAGVFGSVIDEITPGYVSDMLIPLPRDEMLVKRVAAAQAEANAARENAMRLIGEGLALLDDFHDTRLPT